MRWLIAAMWGGRFSLLSMVLLPLSWFYQLIMCIRYVCYRCGLCRVHAFPVPVIVVGNLAVGGTGKTPLTAAIASFYQRRGLKVGLVSRGYGGASKVWPVSVTSDSNPSHVGDEPVMLVAETGCPMVVDPNRPRAVRELLRQHACDVVISDDGLQHYAMSRQLEIAVVDGVRRYGNGRCLPAGPLRESVSRLRRVDAVVCQGEPLLNEFAMQLTVEAVVSMVDASKVTTLSDWEGQTVHAIAGIGYPQRFFALLRAHGLRVIPHAFPDHHPYQQADIQFGDNFPVLMTAKDAVKCQLWVDGAYHCVRVTAECDDGFWSWLGQMPWALSE